MSDSLQRKVTALLQILERRYGKVERPVLAPPPTSADADAVAAVAAKNNQIVAGVVLGLHGPPMEGSEAARKLMAHFVDWNEVRVSRPTTLVAVLGRQPRAPARIALLQRFLEAYFIQQRNLNLDYLYSLKNSEVRRFLSDLEIFSREELAAMLLAGFGIAVFPPAEMLHNMVNLTKLLKDGTTTLQMAKKLETVFDFETLYSLYAHLYALAYDSEGQKIVSKRRGNRKK
ncbi:MAG: hypothetical protein V1899_01895 [Planctomycetota bacterium]